MRRVILAALILGLFLSAGVYGSQALFSARTQNPGGSFAVGTLDLAVSGEGGAGSESFSIDNLGATPEASGQKVWKIKNTGSLPGRLTLAVAKYANLENGCNDQEKSVDETCGQPGSGEGELGAAIWGRVLIAGQEVVPWAKIFKDESELNRVWSSVPPVVLTAGQILVLTLDWKVGDQDYGNEIQSDGLSFNLLINLEQARP